MQAVPLPRCTYLSQHRLWFCDRLSRRDWFDADENNINKKADTSKLWGREKTYLGENSFSSRYCNSLWALLLSNMQAESNPLVIGFGVEKEVVCVLPIGEGSWQLLKGLVPNQQWRTERFLPQGPSSAPFLRKGPVASDQSLLLVSPPSSFLTSKYPGQHACTFHTGSGRKMVSFLCRAAEPKFAKESKCTIYYYKSSIVMSG